MVAVERPLLQAACRETFFDHVDMAVPTDSVVFNQPRPADNIINSSRDSKVKLVNNDDELYVETNCCFFFTEDSENTNGQQADLAQYATSCAYKIFNNA